MNKKEKIVLGIFAVLSLVLSMIAFIKSFIS